jgi:hypothetical protein
MVISLKAGERARATRKQKVMTHKSKIRTTKSGKRSKLNRFVRVLLYLSNKPTNNFNNFLLHTTQLDVSMFTNLPQGFSYYVR